MFMFRRSLPVIAAMGYLLGVAADAQETQEDFQCESGDEAITAGTILSIKPPTTDYENWFVEIRITGGDCNADAVSLQNRPPAPCVVGSALTATGTYEFAEGSPHLIEVTELTCQ